MQVAPEPSTVEMLRVLVIHLAHILHTSCTYLEHILTTSCTHLAHILQTFCTHLAHIFRTHLLHTLHTFCAHLSHILNTSCTHLAQILWTPCTSCKFKNTKCLKDQTCAIFLKSMGFTRISNMTFSSIKCKIHKYKNTSTHYRILGLLLNDGLWMKAICWDCTSVYFNLQWSKDY